jgi:EAL domain-containing protein (putative c-di-GMP-specific phosphodiesterase class I)
MEGLQKGEQGGEQMAAELGAAIEAGQLELYYQPIVSLVTRVAGAVEALPRWPRGKNEVLAPTDFIDVAQRFGLLESLERWAVETAFGQLAGWRRATDVNVSLNLSEDYVYESDLPGEIRSAAERHGVDSARLGIEISETALAGSSGDRLARLNELRELGVGLTVDDYSCGMSKEELGALPTSALKISRRIVAGIPDSRRQTETISGAIELAREIGVRVIANGVESPGQLAALRDLGCEYGQGFLFSIPMPADVLTERTRR